jgi:site-specific DNA recombinase
VEIEYVLGEYSDTPEGNFMRHIRATVAEYEREKINERIIRGRYSKVKAGSVFVSRNAPFGYRLVEEDGRYTLAIYEPEANIVRSMFEWYLSGLSTRKIANCLTEMDIPTYTDSRSKTTGFPRKNRSGGAWSWGTVRNMLQNETYVGTWRYGKVIGRGGWKKRPKAEQISVSVPRIVSQAVWNAAMAVRA